MINRSYYFSSLFNFFNDDSSLILGSLSKYHSQDIVQLQTNAWLSQIDILKQQLDSFDFEGNAIFFEFAIPRMGKRSDVVLVINNIIFVVEFKVGATEYANQAKEQAFDYALDLKHFHEGSHHAFIVPVLLATQAPTVQNTIAVSADGLTGLLCCNQNGLTTLIEQVLNAHGGVRENGAPPLDPFQWAQSAYKPTPTIIQAAQALYQGHEVEEISRSDAGAQNLSATGQAISDVIEHAKANSGKAICFVTGVPGAGKTLAGLNITTNRMRSAEDEHAVFLSGNGPLVEVLREALARDERDRTGLPIGEARRNSKTFIQNIHHFRDDNLGVEAAPVEKVVVFDEAQRAWDQANTAKFMQQKRDQIGFDLSEPEFLIQVMDRHTDWCVIVALIGGGQEINTGEAGLPEWFAALRRSFRHWRVCYSDQLEGEEYTQGRTVAEHIDGLIAEPDPRLHLGVSIRSFRAEKLSAFVRCVINNQAQQAQALYHEIAEHYPIALTRDLQTARNWLKEHARGSELYGLVASSGANRLKPEGINIKTKISPSEWFLNGKADVRSCQYLEDVATEFDIQGLELDWVGVCWDADFRYVFDDESHGQWSHNAFKGTKWQRVNIPEKQRYLANAYRVLLTRARQGMVIYVPEGDDNDPTRPKSYYDCIARFLTLCGVPTL
tara:strand:- start:3593 stop:5590 length:1998 start_codon:yes stop_codon:yes gene_type:complete